jgi:hypothetical protein
MCFFPSLNTKLWGMPVFLVGQKRTGEQKVKKFRHKMSKAAPSTEVGLDSAMLPPHTDNINSGIEMRDPTGLDSPVTSVDSKFLTSTTSRGSYIYIYIYIYQPPCIEMGRHVYLLLAFSIS